MPLHRRLPKRGFNNIFRKEYSIINVKDLSSFEANSSIDENALLDAGLVSTIKDGIKLLGDGEISHPVSIKVHKTSKSAREKVEAAGGKIEMI